MLVWKRPIKNHNIIILYEYFQEKIKLNITIPAKIRTHIPIFVRTVAIRFYFCMLFSPEAFCVFLRPVLGL